MKFSKMFIYIVYISFTCFEKTESKNSTDRYFLPYDAPSSSLTGAHRLGETEIEYITAKKNPYCWNKFARYMVSIRKFEQSGYFGYSHFCAGLIIGPKLILSAAHCFVRDKKTISASSLRVVAGTPARLIKNPATEIVGVAKIKVHELFVSRKNVDVAILKLEHNIKVDTKCAAVVTLPEQRINESHSCMVLGWGRLYYNGPFANLILQINVTLHSKIYCEPFFVDPNTSKYKICASDRRDYAKNPCLGDSGGPLLCEGVLAGIVSYGFECGLGLPSVYTDVFELRHWIKENSCDTVHFWPWASWWTVISLVTLRKFNLV